MSLVGEDIMIELKEKGEKVQNLLEEESKRDPAAEPYKSKYAARDILNDVKSRLVIIIDTVSSTDCIMEKVEAMYGAVLLLLGTICIETEELAAGDEHLMNCVNTLELKAINPKKIVILLKALNQLGLLWSQRADYNKSHEFLQQAEQLYIDYTEQCGERPVDVFAVFTHPDAYETRTKAECPLEREHTLTLYYLAQVYGTLGNAFKSGVYCHNTLKRQMEAKNYDMVEWALNSATLAQFFMEHNAFRQARHHLAAASHMLDRHESELETIKCSEDEHEAKRERLRHRSADVARCWAKYGLVLLSASRDRLMAADDCPSAEATPQRMKPPAELSGLQFSQLELSVYEDQVADAFLLTFDDARAVFLNSQQWLNQAKLYYTMEDHASDHVRIVQDHSELYRNLIFFEDDEERQCKMHKRRADMLDGVLKELNPSYYLTPCRELWFELGEIYSAMLDTKITKIQESSAPTAHALQKINTLAEQSIGSYNQFLESLKDNKTKEVPEVFDKELERPGLLAYFYLARLHSKLIAVDKSTKISNVTRSLQYYKNVVEYCQRNELSKESVSAELSGCQDMVALLPLKLAKLAEANRN